MFIIQINLSKFFASFLLLKLELKKISLFPFNDILQGKTFSEITSCYDMVIKLYKVQGKWYMQKYDIYLLSNNDQSLGREEHKHSSCAMYVTGSYLKYKLYAAFGIHFIKKIVLLCLLNLIN